MHRKVKYVFISCWLQDVFATVAALVPPKKKIFDDYAEVKAELLDEFLKLCSDFKNKNGDSKLPSQIITVGLSKLLNTDIRIISLHTPINNECFDFINFILAKWFDGGTTTKKFDFRTEKLGSLLYFYFLSRS